MIIQFQVFLKRRHALTSSQFCCELKTTLKKMIVVVVVVVKKIYEVLWELYNVGT